MIRLLKLPGSVEAMVVDGSLSAGHARALLVFDDPEPVARKVVARGLNVREVEKLAQAHQKAHQPPAGAGRGAGRGGGARAEAGSRRAGQADDTRTLAKRIAAALGLGVEIDARGAGGEIRIRYETHDELESLCRQLAR